MIDSKFIRKWECTRTKGKTLYILYSGLAISLAAVAGAITSYLFTGNIHFDTTVGIVFGGLIGGLISGITRWNSNEEKYRRLTDANQH